jgi:hypothetical protein
MSGSRDWKGTRYIEVFAQDSVVRFRFDYKNVMATATFRSIVALKKYSFSPEYLNEFEKRLSSVPSVFELFCLMSLRHAVKLKAVSHIVSCDEPLECGLLHETFAVTTDKITLRLQAINPRLSYQTIIELINDVDDACKILIFNFLDIVNTTNVFEKMEEELLLIEEIEYLKNRKEKYIERDNSGSK